MNTSITTHQIFRKHIALPQDHGSWVFLFSPLLIGLFAGEAWTPAGFFLSLSAIAAFLLRQPLTIIVKVFSGRRGSKELPAAWFWAAVYGLIGLVGVAGLVHLGYSYVLYLAIPGAPVFVWHLLLVSRRAERRQIGVELVATGVLALAAPAAYLVGIGAFDGRGWLLWLLVWLQSAASIVYAYLRLEQRDLKAVPTVEQRLSMAWRALLYTTFNLALALVLSLMKIAPPLIFLPFALQWAESIYGTFKPAVKVKPVRIGIRQLIVSTLWTVLFILAWL